MVIKKLVWIIISVVFIFITVAECKGKMGLCHKRDLLGLNGFKAAIHLDTSGRLEKWVGRDCCKWDGVSCNNKTGRVTGINLPGLMSSSDFIFQSKMEGNLSPSITLISYLEVIDLGGLIGLTGNIPPLIGNRLSNLHRLYLYGNNLSGALPASIGKLSKLEELQLHENSLSGLLPYSLGMLLNLSRLLLHTNQFTGSIPESLTKLSNLRGLDIHGNRLTGRIPENIGALQVLKELDISNNFLTGKLPQSLSNLTSISVLYLDTNLLEGNINFPASSRQMTSLSFLRLHDNHLLSLI
ncbi:hypothetical protein C5167_042592 [Papaver somniferum]|uniref:Leucine-rich repeat-containing N-terminal plant-type domain-containing protein n=1 Tax=Papaver somniferum TaxID=3469 RepID=A0A4Y7L5V8_PAPSO|nr:hypothetical protein C5167_042592 [Papaver somniferum]